MKVRKTWYVTTAAVILLVAVLLSAQVSASNAGESGVSIKFLPEQTMQEPQKDPPDYKGTDIPDQSHNSVAIVTEIQDSLEVVYLIPNPGTLGKLPKTGSNNTFGITGVLFLASGILLLSQRKREQVNAV